MLIYWHDSQSSPFTIEHTAAAAADCEIVAVVVPLLLLAVIVSVTVSLTAITGSTCPELAEGDRIYFSSADTVKGVYPYLSPSFPERTLLPT